MITEEAYRKARREEAARYNRSLEEAPSHDHQGGYLPDGATMTDEEIRALGLQPHRMQPTATSRDAG